MWERKKVANRLCGTWDVAKKKLFFYGWYFIPSYFVHHYGIKLYIIIRMKVLSYNHAAYLIRFCLENRFA